MELKTFMELMNTLAPQESALGFDNVGLLIGTQRTDIKKVLVALDCTLDIADEAVRIGADLVLTHHPLMFNGIKRVLPNDPLSAVVYKLIRHDIAMFAAHTNLDAAEGGVNTALCDILGLKNVETVPPENIMRIGNLEKPAMLDDFAELVEQRLKTIAHISGKNRMIRRAAVMGGSGGSDYALAYEHGADVYLTGECKHSQAIEASVLGLAVITAGHHETENCVLEPLIAYLQNRANSVEYVLAEANTPVFRSIHNKSEDLYGR